MVWCVRLAPRIRFRADEPAKIPVLSCNYRLALSAHTTHSLTDNPWGVIQGEGLYIRVRVLDAIHTHTPTHSLAYVYISSPLWYWLTRVPVVTVCLCVYRCVCVCCVVLCCLTCRTHLDSVNGTEEVVNFFFFFRSFIYFILFYFIFIFFCVCIFSIFSFSHFPPFSWWCKMKIFQFIPSKIFLHSSYWVPSARLPPSLPSPLPSFRRGT